MSNQRTYASENCRCSYCSVCRAVAERQERTGKKHMSETLDKIERLRIEARARCRQQRKQTTRRQDSLENATPRGVVVCNSCGAAVPHHVAPHGCQECKGGLK